MLDIYRFEGKHAGKHLLILGAVHGNEIAGPMALSKLVKALKAGNLQIQSGSLTIVPICNPQAYEKDVRFVETNLNRTIKKNESSITYEEELAQHIIPLIDACDYLLDIHSTHVEGDPAFTFMNEDCDRSIDFAKSMGLQTLFVGWEDVYEGEDFSTEAYANSMGKAALTVECGYHKSSDAINIANDVVRNALVFLDMVNCKKINYEEHDIYRFKDKYICEEGDIFVKDWKHMEQVSQGDIIYKKINGNAIHAPYDGYILIPNPNARVGTELFYYGVKHN